MTQYRFSEVNLEIEEKLAVLTLNNPSRLNPLSTEMVISFIQALDIVENKENAIRCLILTGEGESFCAGANLKNIEHIEQLDIGVELETYYHPLMRRLRYLSCPIISVINGSCVGAGNGIALSADIILASKSAYFLFAFRNIGLIPDCGTTWLLSRSIGHARASKLVLLGEKLSAEQALEWGLINDLCEDNTLMDQAKKIARKIVTGPASQEYIRRAMVAGIDNHFEDQLNVEKKLQNLASQTEDFKEGINAFLEKRLAKFKGQ